jgi:hypothetical protein
VIPALVPRYWRVDCERVRGDWHVFQYAAFDSFVLALETAWAHQADVPAWDVIRVVAVREPCRRGRRGLAAGGWLRRSPTP